MTNHANILARFLALLIDSVLLSVVVAVIYAVFGGFMALIGGSENPLLNVVAAASLVVMMLALFLLQFGYFGYFWSTSGQTPGMRLTNVKVVDQATGQPISFVVGALRGSLGYYISGALFGLGYIWAIFDENNEAWHDKLFRTWVVSV